MRKIIYVGYQNFPLAALAACIRVGTLPGDRLPEMKELFKLPYIKGMFSAKGKLTYIGNDFEDNQVYAVWARGGQVLNGTISSFMKIYDLPRESCSIIHVLGPEPYLLELGLSLGRWRFLSGLSAAVAERQLQTLYPPLSGLARVSPGQLDYAW